MGLFSKVKHAIEKVDPVAKATNKVVSKVSKPLNKLAVGVTEKTLGKKAAALVDVTTSKATGTKSVQAQQAAKAAKSTNPTNSAGQQGGMGRLAQMKFNAGSSGSINTSQGKKIKPL